MMKSVENRLKEFVEYHINGDGECNSIVLKRYAENHGLNVEERCDLAFFFSVTYCVCSAIVMYEDKDRLKKDPAEWAEANKNRLIFQSDRKYVRLQDRFKRILSFYGSNLDGRWKETLKQYCRNGSIDIAVAIRTTEKWFYFGRFAAFLFLETLSNLLALSPLNAPIEWQKGDTATSGLLNLFGFDSEATVFDKSGLLLKDPAEMDAMLVRVQKAIKERGGEDNTTYVETSLCAYRKLYKGTRYNGYYLDRMLEEILFMYPKYPQICDEALQIRSGSFDHSYLGEICGWNGIRKHMKKYYLEHGCIN